MRCLIAGFDLTDYTRQETLKVEHDLGDPIPIIDIVLEDPYASTIPPALDCLQEVCILNEPFQYNQARNYVVDPTFASGSAKYTVSNPIGATMTYTSNQIKAKISNASVGTVSIAQTTQALLIQPLQSYMFSAYLTLSTDALYVPRFGGGTLIFQSVPPLSNANAFIQMDFLDAGSNLVTSIVSANYTAGTRQQISISGVAPAGCYYVKVYCGLTTTNGTNSGTAIFDTLQLEPMFFQQAGAYSTQSYPSPDCVVGNANCRVLANGVTVREDRLFCGYITNLDADYEGANRLWTLECSGPAFVTAATSITTTYASATDAGIVADIVSTNFPKLFTVQNVLGTGYQFDQVEWEDVFVRDVFNSVSQAAGDTWFIDPYFDVHFYPPGTNQSDFALSDSPDDVTSFEYYGYTYTRTVTNMANRLKVFGAGANNTNPVTTDTFDGDGSTKIFNLTIRPETITSVTVGGTTQKVGQFGIQKNGVGGIQCLVNKGLKEIIFNTAPPNAAQNVAVNYNYIAPAIMRLWDMGSISKYGLVLDSRIDDGSLVTNADVLQRGLQDLQTDSTPQTSIVLSTQKSGLQVGDTIPMTSVPDNLLSQSFLIQKVRAVILGTDDNEETVTEYQATLGPYLPTFLHHMKFVHKSVKHARTKTSVAAEEHLVTFDTIDYSENPTISIDTSVTTGGASDGAGVTIGFNIGNNNTLYAHWSQLFADMATLGLTWVRVNYSWKNIERTQGVYTWLVLDDAVTQINASGYKIEFCLREAPAWGLDPANGAQQANTEPFYLPSPSLMAGFATAVMTRYNGVTIITGGGVGHLDAIGFNEDFNIENTSVTDTLTLNQTLNSGTTYTSFSINSSGFTPLATTKLYFKGYASADVATISSDVSNGDTTVHCASPSFTPATTYHAGDTINIAYMATNTGGYSLYDPGTTGKTTANTHKGQPSRNPIFGAAVFNAVAPAIRAVNSTIWIGLPLTWWVQPVSAGNFPGSPSNMSAFMEYIFDHCGAHIDANTFMDGHFYSNTVDPVAGSGSVSTIAQWIADFRGMATNKGYPNMPHWVSEFGWQANTVTTSSTAVASAGSHTITVASATGAAIGVQIFVERADHSVSETTTLTAVSGTSLTAVFAHTYSGTYNVTILLDCDAATQATRYTNVLTAIAPGTSHGNKAFLFTLFYDAGGTGGSLVKPDGTHQPAYAAVQSYIAAHNSSSGGGGLTNYAIDTFVGRTVSNAWGLASDAINFWSQPDGACTPSVGSGEGQLTGKVDTNEMICGSTVVKDLEIVVRLTATVANFKAGAISRYTNLNNYYFARINDSNSKLEICKYVGGNLTVLASTTFNPTPGTFYWLRFRTQGSSLKANAWQDGTVEPAGYMLTKTDTSLTGANRFGLYSIANTTGTVTKFDTFSAVSV